MPTYLYWCAKHNEFEDFHSMSKIHKECPKCKEEGLEPVEFKQLINSSTKGRVELTGNDLVAKVKQDTQKLKQEMHGSEYAYANALGPDKYEQLQRKIDKNKRER